MEIERKFLVADLPDLKAEDGILLRQGYLATVPVEVRVRSCADERFFLTIKGSGALERQEVELLLERSQFLDLWPLTEGRRIEKVRYRLPLGRHVLELDVYRDPHDGLVTAEVEFDDTHAAADFNPPSWLGAEVTHDRRFKNAELALTSAPPSQQAPTRRSSASPP